MNNDGRTLQQYGISHESCLHIVILSGWIIRVEDRHNPGRVLEVLIEGHDPQVYNMPLVFKGEPELRTLYIYIRIDLYV